MSTETLARRLRDRGHPELAYALELAARPVTGDKRGRAKPSPSEWREIYDKAGSPTKWLCCSRPELKPGGTKGRYWASTCTFERKGKRYSVHRKVGDDPTRKPTKVVIKGKKVRWC